jgi:hypothetical protein
MFEVSSTVLSFCGPLCHFWRPYSTAYLRILRDCSLLCVRIEAIPAFELVLEIERFQGRQVHGSIDCLFEQLHWSPANSRENAMLQVVLRMDGLTRRCYS